MASFTACGLRQRSSPDPPSGAGGRLEELVRVNLAAFRAGNAPALSAAAAAQLTTDAARAQWQQFFDADPLAGR